MRTHIEHWTFTDYTIYITSHQYLIRKQWGKFTVVSPIYCSFVQQECLYYCMRWSEVAATRPHSVQCTCLFWHPFISEYFNITDEEYYEMGLCFFHFYLLASLLSFSLLSVFFSCVSSFFFFFSFCCCFICALSFNVDNFICLLCSLFYVGSVFISLYKNPFAFCITKHPESYTLVSLAYCCLTPHGMCEPRTENFTLGLTTYNSLWLWLWLSMISCTLSQWRSTLCSDEENGKQQQQQQYDTKNKKIYYNESEWEIQKPEFKWIKYDTYRYASACAVRFRVQFFSLVCVYAFIHP